MIVPLILFTYLFFEFPEMVVPEVNTKLLEELEAIGFPKAKATRALYYSGKDFSL